MSVTAASLKSGKGAQAAEAPPKKSRKKLFVILAVLVVLIGGYEAKSILLKPHYTAGQKVPLGKILPLDQILTNLADGHDVQVNISIQLTSVANTSAMSADLPRFDDAAISVLSADTQSQLLPAAGRAEAKAQMLARFQKIAGTVDGAAQQVTAVYFTNFVIQ